MGLDLQAALVEANRAHGEKPVQISGPGLLEGVQHIEKALGDPAHPPEDVP